MWVLPKFWFKSWGSRRYLEFYDMLVNLCVNIMLNLQQEAIDFTW